MQFIQLHRFNYFCCTHRSSLASTIQIYLSYVLVTQVMSYVLVTQVDSDAVEFWIT